jgi:hypothetical protein
MQNKLMEKDSQYHITKERRSQSEEDGRHKIERILTLKEREGLNEHPQRNLKDGKKK